MARYIAPIFPNAPISPPLRIVIRPNIFFQFNLRNYYVAERRDETEGFSKGEFRGASGYKPKDPRVLKLEPEDLNEQCLNEIEDVNTLEGAISQMQSKAKERNSFRSKMGTTALDVEM